MTDINKLKTAVNNNLPSCKTISDCQWHTWYMLPQPGGLGFSSNSFAYGIYRKSQAIDYLNDELCGSNLLRHCRELLDSAEQSAIRILGDIGATKLKSSMTLFDSIATDSDNLFGKVLDKYFEGHRDPHTLCRFTLYQRITSALKFIGVDTSDFNLRREMFARRQFNPMHGYSHLYRVMIASALIAHKINQPRLGLLAFFGAYIHDLGRQNDAADREHGANSVRMHLHSLQPLFDKYKITPEERQCIADAATFHCARISRHISDDAMTTLHILKDADALDRCRFRNRGARLDVNFLHFRESRSCITPLKYCFASTIYFNLLNNEIPFSQFVDYLKWE